MDVSIIVDPYVDEVILSDAVAGELGISILDMKGGCGGCARTRPV